MTKTLGFKNKVLHRFETNTLTDYGKKKPCTGEERNQVNQKTQNQPKEDIIKSIRNLFKLKKKMRPLKIK